MSSRRKVDQRRDEYVKALDELIELADAARRGLVASLQDENECVPLRVTYELGIKSYAAFDKWRLYRRARAKAKRRRRKIRQRQLTML